MANTKPALTEVQAVANILPTGFYLGQRIEFDVVEGIPESYFDPMQFIIKISYDQIPDIQLDADTLEDDLRCILYHEVSHAMLTPPDGPRTYGLFKIGLDEYYILNRSKRANDLYDKIYDWTQAKNQIKMKYWEPLKPYWRDMINIFEDQRIETINGNLFMRVDFPSFVKKVNDYDNTKNMPIQDPQILFYHIVRFNDMYKDLVKRTYEIIYKYAHVNAVKTDDVTYYLAEVFDLACDCLDIFNNNASQQAQQGNPNGSGQGQGQVQGNQAQGNQAQGNQDDQDENSLETIVSTEQFNQQSGDQSAQDNPSGHSGSMPNDPTQSKDVSEDEAKALIEAIIKKIAEENNVSPEEALEAIKQQAIKEVLGRYDCTKNFNQSVERIILRMLRKKSIEAKSLAGYSGRINPKNIHKPGHVENYRWFDKANPNGINATTGKFRINFFCDNSGSFEYNMNKANSVIRCLYNLSIKYPAFSFDLVTNGNGSKLRTKNNLALDCNEGTYLNKEIFEIYGNLQKQGQTIWNIVLFDGGLCGGTRDPNGLHKNYSAFNHHNVIMICDTEDQKYIEKYCPNAHKIFTNNYMSELEDNLIRCMDQMFR